MIVVFATGVTSSAAVLNATGVPRGDTTIGWFRYSTTNPGTCNDTFGTRLPAAGGTALGADNATVPFAEALSGLPLGTTHYFCAIAANGIGMTFGGVVQFTTTAAPPTLTTVAATLVTATGATLNGTVNPNGLSTTVWFRYATTSPGTCNDSFGTRAPSASASDQNVGSGLTPLNFNRAISALTPTTTYFYCALANNSLGTSFGAVLSFVTPAMTPTVTTSAITVTSGTTATLNGSANPNGAVATGWFRYATTNPGTCNDTFGSRAPVGSGGSGVGAGRRDVVTDFARGQDTLDLLSIDANAGQGGDQAFAFVGTRAFSGAGQVRLAKADGNTVVQGSTDGDAAPEFEVLLTGSVNPTAGDFLL